MLQSAKDLLHAAQAGGYAVGAFNVYNLEGVLAVVRAAEAAGSPAILQFHPASLAHGGAALIAAAKAAAQDSRTPVGLHLDHSSSESAICDALALGLDSVMADGSGLPFEENLRFTQQMTALAHESGAVVEAEIGKLSGTEDGLSIAEWEAKMTDPELVAEYVSRTGADSLAVCIGNVHGVYHAPPQLDFQRLAAIRDRVDIPLVLHGASGLPSEMISSAIDLGVARFNVNTELRAAFLAATRASLADPKADILIMLDRATKAMQAVVLEKLRLFRSEGVCVEVQPA